jgi:hypothetical protein
MRKIALAIALGLLAACGGGGNSPLAVAAGSSDVPSAAVNPTVVAANASLTGSIVKGPVSNAQVCVYELISTGKGNQLGCTASNADGSYALDISFEGEVVVEAVGGSYTDEATGLAGVKLEVPLTTAAKLSQGPNVVHATPLTTLAFGRSVGAGPLSVASYAAKATEVRDAFGLSADVDLNSTLPDVRTGLANPYGKALRGISKMLGMGATLAGVVGNGDLVAIKKSYAQALSCLPSVDIPAKAAAAAIASEGQVVISGGVIDFDGSIFTVTNPDPAWRALLSGSGTPMGCTVTTNTAEEVVMNCPRSALLGDLTLTSGTYLTQAVVPATSPESGILLMGVSIQVQGGLTVGGNISISTDTFSNFGAIIGAGNVLISTTQGVADYGTINFSGQTTPPLIGSVCLNSLNNGGCGGGIPGWPREGYVIFSVGPASLCGNSAMSSTGVLAY